MIVLDWWIKVLKAIEKRKKKTFMCGKNFFIFIFFNKYFNFN